MKLTENNIVSNKHWAGHGDWGRNYMRGLNKKGWMCDAWNEGWYGYDSLFAQRLLAEARWN